MTLLFTPTNEQLKELLAQNPELYSSLSEKILDELKVTATKYVTNNLNNHVQRAYSELYKKVEKNYFKDTGYTKTFSTQYEDKFSAKIKDRLEQELEKELDNYLSSERFIKDIKLKIQSIVLDGAIKSLDRQIQEEISKLTSV